MVLIKAISDYVEGAGMHVIEVRRLGMIILLQRYNFFTNYQSIFIFLQQKAVTTAYFSTNYSLRADASN